MRDGWIETTLGEISALQMGRTPSRRESSYWTEDLTYPFCTIADMDSKYVEPKREGVTKAAIKDGKAKVAKKGTLLMSFKLTIGRMGFAVRDIFPNEAIVMIEADESKVLNHFLYLRLASMDLTEGSGRAVKGSTLNSASIASISFLVPPLTEQKRIIDLISSVDSYIEALQQQLESVKKSRNALVESQILELADSRLSSLKNLSTKIGSGATPRGGEQVYIETGVNLIRSQNVHDSNFVMRGLVAIEDSAAKALENVTVEDGDVLINITGASVTRCCVVDSTILPARVNQHVAIIRSDRTKILPKYLVLVLTSNDVKGFLNDIAGTGSTRQALTKTHLEDLEIPVPNISKQTEIIENSDAFDSAISKSQMALDGARILRSGLLNNLLSGEHEIPASYDKVIGAA